MASQGSTQVLFTSVFPLENYSKPYIQVRNFEQGNDSHISSEDPSDSSMAEKKGRWRDKGTGEKKVYF